MKIPMFRSKEKKLRAVARSADGYDDEPTMKLSSAVFVVLILHVVALGGIFVFDKIRAERPTPLEPAAEAAAVAQAAPALNTGAKTADDDDQARVPAKTIPVLPKEAGKNNTSVGKESAEFYTVAKGDNPASISRKLHVSFDALVRLNKIEDAKKLQIGQKLRLPQKKAAQPAKSDG